MADASAHYKQMENFMRSEIFMFVVKNRKLQRINDTAYCIYQPSCQKPEEGGPGKRIPQLAEHCQANPAHGDVDYGRKPFGAGNPYRFNSHSEDGNAPDNGQKRISQLAAKDYQAYGGIGACYQDENHHMINLAEYPKNPSSHIDGMVSGAGAVQQNQLADWITQPLSTVEWKR